MVGERLTRSEVAQILGIDYEALSQLMGKGIVRPSAHTGPASEGAKGYRGNLLFTPDDVRQAQEAMTDLRWLAVVSPDSWERLTGDGLRYTLLSQRYARVAQTLRPGNRVAFYLTGRSRFVGTARITGRVQKKRVVWPQGAYPFSVPLEPEVVVRPEQGASAKAVLEHLDFVGNKSAWEHSFRTTMRLITSADFERIIQALHAVRFERTPAPSSPR